MPDPVKYRNGTKVRATKRTYSGRWIEAGERGEVIAGYWKSLYLVRLDDGYQCLLTFDELERQAT